MQLLAQELARLARAVGVEHADGDVQAVGELVPLNPQCPVMARTVSSRSLSAATSVRSRTISTVPRSRPPRRTGCASA
jgi:hypothetical protein